MRRAPFIAGIGLALAVVSLLAPGSVPAQSQMRVTPLSNGTVAVDMRGCSVLFDRQGRIINQGLSCNSSQIRSAQQAYRDFRSGQNSSGGGGGSGYLEVTGVPQNSLGLLGELPPVSVDGIRNGERVRDLRRCVEYNRETWCLVEYGGKPGWAPQRYLKPASGPGQGAGGGSTQTLECASENNRYRFCRARVRGAEVRLVRKLSKSSCQYQRDWGYEADGVWVSNGCRATFQIVR